MNDEKAFQMALDEDPDDHVLRTIFADWLDDRDDPRAEGYRALGMNQRRPRKVQSQKRWQFYRGPAPTVLSDPQEANFIDPEWFDLVDLEQCVYCVTTTHKDASRCSLLENEFASSFPRLSAHRRAKLLKQQEVTA